MAEEKETLWDAATTGCIIFEDNIIENTGRVLSTARISNPESEEGRFYGCVSCQEVSRVCTFCHDCITHHKAHKYHILNYTVVDCTCCGNEHACKVSNFADSMSVLDAPHPISGKTPLYIATENSHVGFIGKLINMNGNINALNSVSTFLMLHLTISTYYIYFIW